MSTANMKLVVLDVPLNGDMEFPDQNLDDGEAIVRRVVELRNLNKALKGDAHLVQQRVFHAYLPIKIISRILCRIRKKGSQNNTRLFIP